MADSRRPDPNEGVFETLLVVDGRPVELEAHLARLEESLAELFPAHPTSDLREELEARAREIELGSVRATVAPAGPDRSELRAYVESRQAPGPLIPLFGHKGPIRRVSLHRLALPGGLGAHKWADRSLLDAAQAVLPAGALPLIVDADGTVLEASRANVFAVQGETLFTPPTDGRILPGITRMRVLELADATGLGTEEIEFSREDLLAADEVFLTGSVRGVEQVSSLDGRELAAGGCVAEDLGAELWRTWTAARVG